jgi:large subunit ribosomal protein L25
MNTSFEIQAESRADKGKGASRRLRRKGLVPAILYGAEQPSVSIAVSHQQLQEKLKNKGFYSHVLTVNLNGESVSAVMRDLQRHPSEQRILHLDLLRVSADQEIRMQVPLRFIGEAQSPGVKQQGGIFSHQLSEVEIECLPRNLPEFIEVNVSEMKLNDVLHLSDLKLPGGVELPALRHGADHDLPVVTLHMPKAAVEEEAPAADQATVEGGAAAAATPATPTPGK